MADARRRGFLGPGPVEGHIAHARAFHRHWAPPDEATSLDLGSGAGVPGLVLAHDRPGSAWVLLDASGIKTAFLVAATASLGLADRVTVLTGRAEDVGRHVDHRGTYDVVVARSFARPAVLAECAAPLLRVGGALLVSEPPDRRERWSDAVGQLGLVVAKLGDVVPRITMLCQIRPCPDRYPRRVGIPSKRPLW